MDPPGVRRHRYRARELLRARPRTRPGRGAAAGTSTGRGARHHARDRRGGQVREIADLRAGVVGTGFIGVVHVDALRRLGVEVTGVVGSTRERAEGKRTAPAYESSEALLAAERADVVPLTTRNRRRYPQVRQALEAGRHVVCEKPLALTAAESADL